MTVMSQYMKNTEDGVKALYRQPTKLTAKLPMQHKVVGERYDVYEYSIHNKKVYYHFLHFLTPETKQLKH